jgi:hypothetical protein
VSIETISTFRGTSRRSDDFASSWLQLASASSATNETTAAQRRGRVIASEQTTESTGAGIVARSSLRLGPADRFLLLVDRELRRRALHGFQAVLAVELEGALDDAKCKALAAAWSDALAEQPRATARLARRWLGLGPWRLEAAAAAPSFRVRPRASSDLLALASERLNAPLDPTRDPLVDLEVERGAARLALRWWHPAMDERGAELLLHDVARRFDASNVGDDSRSSSPSTLPRPSAFTPPTTGMTFGARRAAFRAARKRLDELTSRTPFTLAPTPTPTPQTAVAVSAGSWHVNATTLDAAESARFLAASDERFGPRGEGLAQAALVFEALARLAPDDCELALPLSVQLRPPRAHGPIAANALSFLWLALPASAARDRDALARTLRETMRRKVAALEERDAWALLEFGRWLPTPLYRRELVRRDGSSRFSASLSTLGDLLGGARELFGARLRDAVALTAFPSPPSLGVVFSRAAGRLRVATTSAPSLVDAAAAQRLHELVVARARELALLSSPP